ncbi:hypothetical protein CTAYLR_006388 [Chrysophaeum taylorii]|uniref:RidA family protein n=1 Tax=Chrysophaeum taylorii TaxID=2483200 RepID=A0AAD7U7H6_9STRA|nr:hypothetical protein CTAYLR_006388 [Chrysophaeum taylorii]
MSQRESPATKAGHQKVDFDHKVVVTKPALEDRAMILCVLGLGAATLIEATGPWGLSKRGGEFVFVAGMRGIEPATNKLVEGPEARIRQAFLNMAAVAAGDNATLEDATRLVVYVTDMFRYRPIVNSVQEEFG